MALRDYVGPMVYVDMPTIRPIQYARSLENRVTECGEAVIGVEGRVHFNLIRRNSEDINVMQGTGAFEILNAGTYQVTVHLRMPSNSLISAYKRTRSGSRRRMVNPVYMMGSNAPVDYLYDTPDEETVANHVSHHPGLNSFSFIHHFDAREEFYLNVSYDAYGYAMTRDQQAIIRIHRMDQPDPEIAFEKEYTKPIPEPTMEELKQRIAELEEDKRQLEFLLGEN